MSVQPTVASDRKEAAKLIVSFVNVKGGVGKTTSAVNLAAAFAGSDLEVGAQAYSKLGAEIIRKLRSTR